jgi:hypothetical protein
MVEIQKKIQNELDKYLNKTATLQAYYGIKNILVSELFEQQITTILEELSKDDPSIGKNFKLYLDTIIINMGTKIKKYKKSIYSDNENIKDIQNQGYNIPFYVDQKTNNYIILGIFANDNKQ